MLKKLLEGHPNFLRAGRVNKAENTLKLLLFGFEICRIQFADRISIYVMVQKLSLVEHDM